MGKVKKAKKKKHPVKREKPKLGPTIKDDDARLELGLKLAVTVGSIIYIIGLFLPFRYSYMGPEPAIKVLLLGPAYFFLMVLAGIMGIFGIIKKKNYGGILFTCTLGSSMEPISWVFVMISRNPFLFIPQVPNEFGSGLTVILIGIVVALFGAGILAVDVIFSHRFRK
jgi:hypothetical protein